jgi:hypothetical protein
MSLAHDILTPDAHVFHAHTTRSSTRVATFSYFSEKVSKSLRSTLFIINFTTIYVLELIIRSTLWAF